VSIAAVVDENDKRKAVAGDFVAGTESERAGHFRAETATDREGTCDEWPNDHEAENP
jgi:hypothetical protein